MKFSSNFIFIHDFVSYAVITLSQVQILYECFDNACSAVVLRYMLLVLLRTERVV